MNERLRWYSVLSFIILDWAASYWLYRFLDDGTPEGYIQALAPAGAFGVVCLVFYPIFAGFIQTGFNMVVIAILYAVRNQGSGE